MSKTEVYSLLSGLLFTVFVFAAALKFAEYRCGSQWPENNPEWGPITGCMIAVDGKRIPAANHRVL